LRRMRGGLRLTLRRRSRLDGVHRSSAVGLPPCQGGSGFGDESCDRRSYSRVVGWRGNDRRCWPVHGDECRGVGELNEFDV
jgi:hypothetical protein